MVSGIYGVQRGETRFLCSLIWLKKKKKKKKTKKKKRPKKNAEFLHSLISAEYAFLLLLLPPPLRRLLSFLLLLPLRLFHPRRLRFPLILSFLFVGKTMCTHKKVFIHLFLLLYFIMYFTLFDASNQGY